MGGAGARPPCTVVVPEHAPETKLAAIERLGGTLKVPYERWWQAISESSFPEAEGVFIHPVQDERVMAGNGTIGLEILDDLPEPDRVLVPFGGGGLSVGIASAVKAVRPATEVYAVEPETGAPLTAAFESGEPRPVEYRSRSWTAPARPRSCRRCGRARAGPSTARSASHWTGQLRQCACWPSEPVSSRRAPVRWRSRPLCKRVGRDVVCVVSGGNIDASKLTKILAGTTP